MTKKSNAPRKPVFANVTFSVRHNGDSAAGIGGEEVFVTMPLSLYDSEALEEWKAQLRQMFTDAWQFKAGVSVHEMEDEDFKPFECPSDEKHLHYAANCHCQECGESGVLLNQDGYCRKCHHKEKWPGGCPVQCDDCLDQAEALEEQRYERLMDR